ncbi:hypothetical protein HPG69_005559, partial [Diceros bicornis minor]
VSFEPPPAISTADYYSSNRNASQYATVVTYWCLTGPGGEKQFDLMVEQSVSCSSKDNQPEVENAIRLPGNRSLFSLSETVRFRCQSGFAMKGPHTLQCWANNTVKSCAASLDQHPNGCMLFPFNIQLGKKVSFVLIKRQLCYSLCLGWNEKPLEQQCSRVNLSLMETPQQLLWETFPMEKKLLKCDHQSEHAHIHLRSTTGSTLEAMHLCTFLG